MASKTAYFYKIAKRKNSTLIPTNGTAVGVDLKAGTDLISPSFIIQMDNEPDFNMIKYESRYYFINRITSIRDKLWNIECEEDYLATWKSNILNTRAYLIYSPSGNSDLVDSRLGIETTPVVAKNDVLLPFVPDDVGSYVCIAMGEDRVQSFKIQPHQIKNLLLQWDTFTEKFDQLLGFTPTEASVGECIIGLGKQMIGTNNLSDKLKRIFWTPISVTTGEVDNIYLGYYDTGVLGHPIDALHVTGYVSIAIPWHYDDWRRNAPYSEVYLYLPYVGMIQYPTSDLIGVPSLQIKYVINQNTGEVAYQVTTTDTGQILGVYTADTSIDLQIGSSNINLLNMAGSAITAAVSSPNFMSGAMNAVNAAASAAIHPIEQTIGMNGGAASKLDSIIHCVTVTHKTTQEPEDIISTLGMPDFTAALISSKGNGYIKCENASVSGTMLDDEREALNNLLNGGIYIE